MTKEEFKQYSELQEKFANNVLRVVSFLKEIDEDLNFVSEFQLIDGSVKTHGWEYWPFQGSEEHYGFFDAEMLTWTDDELKKYVEQIKKGKEEERVREEIEKWAIEEFAPEIQGWIIKEFSPQIEKWVKDYVMDNHTALHIEDFCGDDSVDDEETDKK